MLFSCQNLDNDGLIVAAELATNLGQIIRDLEVEHTASQKLGGSRGERVDLVTDIPAANSAVDGVLGPAASALIVVAEAVTVKLKSLHQVVDRVVLLGRGTVDTGVDALLGVVLKTVDGDLPVNFLLALVQAEDGVAPALTLGIEGRKNLGGTETSTELLAEARLLALRELRLARLATLNKGHTGIEREALILGRITRRTTTRHVYITGKILELSFYRITFE